MEQKDLYTKSFDFAADVAKQLITLATAIIATTITFSKEILGVSDNDNTIMLLLSWILFVVSIIFGLMTLMALTGILAETSDSRTSNNKGIYTCNVCLCEILQMVFFLIALGFSICYGYSSLSHESDNQEWKEINETIQSIDCQIYDSLRIDTLMA